MENILEKWRGLKRSVCYQYKVTNKREFYEETNVLLNLHQLDTLNRFKVLKVDHSKDCRKTFSLYLLNSEDDIEFNIHYPSQNQGHSVDK